MVQVTGRVSLLVLPTHQRQEEAFVPEFHLLQRQLANLIIPVINENHLLFHYTHTTYKTPSKRTVSQKLTVNSIKGIGSVLCRYGTDLFWWVLMGSLLSFLQGIKY